MIIVSLGMALVIGTGGVDLSVGAIMAIASAVLARFVLAPGDGGLGASIGVAMLFAVVAGVLVGVFNGTLVAVARVQPIVATLGMLVAGRGIALVITGGALIELFVPFFRTVRLGKLLGVPYVMWMAAVLAVLAAILVRRTAFGYRLLAIGGNRRASVLAGLPVRRTLITVYALSGGLAAVAGVIATARLRASDPSYLGLLIELTAITAWSWSAGTLRRRPGPDPRDRRRRRAHPAARDHARLAQHPGLGRPIVEAVIIIAAVYVQRSRSTSMSVQHDGDELRVGPDGAVAVAADRGGRAAALLRSRSVTSVVSAQRGRRRPRLVVVVLGIVVVPTFGSADNLRNIALSASFIAIIAVGMTFVIISGGIDLSVGSMFALAVVLSAHVSPYGSFAAIVVPLVACAAVGLRPGADHRVAAAAAVHRHAGRADRRSAAWSSSSPTRATTSRRSRVTGRSRRSAQGQLLDHRQPGLDHAAASSRSAGGLLNRTAFGQTVQAVGGNDAAAELMGLPGRRTTTLVYVISGLCAGSGRHPDHRAVAAAARRPDRRRVRAVRDRRRRHRRHLLTGGVGSMVGTLGRHRPAVRDPEPHRAGRQPQLLRPAGRLRRVPAGGRHPAGDRQPPIREGRMTTSTTITGEVAATVAELRREVSALHAELPRNELVVWTAGNVSARVPGRDLLVIKPSGVALRRADPGDHGGHRLRREPGRGRAQPVVGHGRARVRLPPPAEVGGVVHTHSTYATAWAARGEPIPCVLTMMADEFGGEIPVGPFALIGDDSIGRGIVETLRGTASPAVLMRNHGPFTIGRDARAAVKAAVMWRRWPGRCTSPGSSASRCRIDQADIDALYRALPEHLRPGRSSRARRVGA